MFDNQRLVFQMIFVVVYLQCVLVLQPEIRFTTVKKGIFNKYLEQEPKYVSLETKLVFIQLVNYNLNSTFNFYFGNISSDFFGKY